MPNQTKPRRSWTIGAHVGVRQALGDGQPIAAERRRQALHGLVGRSPGGGGHRHRPNRPRTTSRREDDVAHHGLSPQHTTTVTPAGARRPGTRAATGPYEHVHPDGDAIAIAIAMIIPLVEVGRASAAPDGRRRPARGPTPRRSAGERAVGARQRDARRLVGATALRLETERSAAATDADAVRDGIGGCAGGSGGIDADAVRDGIGGCAGAVGAGRRRRGPRRTAGRLRWDRRRGGPRPRRDRPRCGCTEGSRLRDATDGAFVGRARLTWVAAGGY